MAIQWYSTGFLGAMALAIYFGVVRQSISLSN